MTAPKRPPKGKRPGKSPVARMFAEQVQIRDDLKKLRADVNDTAEVLSSHQETTAKSLQTVGDVSAHNSRVLCDYVDDIADRVHGMAEVLIAYTDSVADTLEEITNHEKGWAPRVSEGMLVAAAQQHRERRIADYERRQEGQEPPSNVTPLKPLGEMTDAEITKATEKQTADPAASYPDGTQFFGK